MTFSNAPKLGILSIIVIKVAKNTTAGMHTKHVKLNFRTTVQYWSKQTAGLRFC